MAVPLKNVYYLLCYAWDRLEARNLIDVDAIPGDRVENLLAKVLTDGVGHLIRRGLDRGYVPCQEDGRRLRGKLMLSETIQRALLPRGRVACEWSDLSSDVPHNRVIKAAVTTLIGLQGLDEQLRSSLVAHQRRLQGIADVPLSPTAFRNLQLHRNLARYSFLVNACQLLMRSLLPDQTTGLKRFHPFTANEQEMGLLFEAFVRNFLRREQDVFSVSAPKVSWDVEPLASSDLAWLPEMRTDVMLANTSQRVVIETKYYDRPYQSRHGTKKLISNHIYQLFTYLSQLSATDGPSPMGVLLYAGAPEDQTLDYRLGSYTVLVRGLNLNVEWRDVHRDLLLLVNDVQEAAPRQTRPRRTALAPSLLTDGRKARSSDRQA